MLLWRRRKGKEGTGGNTQEVEDLTCEASCLFTVSLFVLKTWISFPILLFLIVHLIQISNPDKERRHGKCPLTPEEVGLMLRGLGFGADVHIYVASGEVYGGEESLASLKALFPNFHSKETLASKEELAPFLSFSSRMAALDFVVCDGSDVFVTNNNGNMARMLAGRRYAYFSILISINFPICSNALSLCSAGDILVIRGRYGQMLESFTLYF